MSSLFTRILVAAVLLPPVLLLIWTGGWWLFGLAAVVSVLALHEFYGMTRDLRPVLLAGYAGTFAALVGAEWGPQWALAGFLSTFAFSFVFKGMAGVRPTTVSVAATVLGVPGSASASRTSSSSVGCRSTASSRRSRCC